MFVGSISLCIRRCIGSSFSSFVQGGLFLLLEFLQCRSFTFKLFSHFSHL